MTIKQPARLFLGTLIALTLLLLLILSKPSERNSAHSLSLPKQPEAHAPAHGYSTSYTVKNHDSLSTILHQLPVQLPFPIARKLLRQSTLSTLHPGQIIKISASHGHLVTMLSTHHHGDSIKLRAIDKQWRLTRRPVRYTVKTSFATGHIGHTLLGALSKAGLPGHIKQQFIHIFEGPIRLKRDLQPEDRFALLYEKKYDQGSPVQSGDILIAEITSHGKLHQAIRFHDLHQNTHYYTPAGKRISPRFLSYPVKFKRISSHFNYHRVDPILHKVHPHLGIDFAAHRGTPIHSIGAGKVIFANRLRGYGNAIKICYDRHYCALYAHMQRFAHNIRAHLPVKKGATIGYVGSTGWSTGPHLHFSFYINGIPKDWLSIKPPTPPPLNHRQKKAFVQYANTQLETLKLYQNAPLN